MTAPSDHDLARSLLVGMVEIPSLSGAEGCLAIYVRDRLEELGFRAWIDAVGNVIGETGRGDQGDPSIMLLGHLDTVGPILPVKVEGGRIWGRGAVDAKGPLATMICAARRLAEQPLRIRVVGVIEEELPASRGAVEIGRNPPPHALVVGEPSGWANVVIGYKGKLDLSYTVKLPQAHSSRPGETATTALVAFWSSLLEALGPQDSAFDRPTAALCEVRGTLSEARADVSCRLPARFDVPGFLERLRDDSGTAALCVRNVVDAVRVPRSAPVVRALSWSIRQQGGTPTHRLRGGTSDMNTLAAVWDIPMATYGPGDNTLEHTDEEHICMDELMRSIAVLTGAVEKLGRELASRPAIAANNAIAATHEGGSVGG